MKRTPSLSAMIAGIGFEALDDALIFRQPAKSAVQVGIGPLRFQHGELAETEKRQPRQHREEIGIAAAGVQHQPLRVG